jgi:hypothetical protein
MIVDCKKKNRNMITPEPMKGVVWQTVALVKLRQPAQGVVWQTVAPVKLRQPAHP